MNERAILNIIADLKSELDYYKEQCAELREKIQDLLKQIDSMREENSKLRRE